MKVFLRILTLVCVIMAELIAATLSHAIDKRHDHEVKISAPDQEKAQKKILYWYDPMVPGKYFDKSGKSPFMDMDLVPKYAEEGDDADTGRKPVVSISAENIQKMGVRTERVKRDLISQSIRATGIVLPNERTRWDMFSQVEGRVNNLKYSAIGDKVTKGEVFYTLYSPELVALQNDYLAAQQGRLEDMAQAAKKRLLLLGVDKKVLADITKTGKAFDDVPFYAPADGVLTKLEIRNGHYLAAGGEVGHVQDLSTVWIEAAISEQDLGKVKEQDRAVVRFTGSNIAYTATIDYIYPMIMPETRTGKVRLIMNNKDGNLRPNSYATVEFAGTAMAAHLTLPSAAILKDSEGQHVIISLGDGKFQARTVKTGAVSAGRTVIVEGLQEDDEVAISAQFLIDSESSLRESLKKISAPAAETNRGY